MRLRLEVRREFASDLQDYLQDAGFECERLIMEALGAPEIIYVSAGSLTIIDIVYRWITAKKEKTPDITVVILTDDGTRVELDKVEPDEAKKYLEGKGEL